MVAGAKFKQDSSFPALVSRLGGSRELAIILSWVLHFALQLRLTNTEKATLKASSLGMFKRYHTCAAISHMSLGFLLTITPPLPFRPSVGEVVPQWTRAYCGASLTLAHWLIFPVLPVCAAKLPSEPGLTSKRSFEPALNVPDSRG